RPLPLPSTLFPYTTLFRSDARYNPESAGQYGMSGVDEKIIDLKPRSAERRAADVRRAGDTLAARLGAETDPLVRQDLEILMEAADRKSTRLNSSHDQTSYA